MKVSQRQMLDSFTDIVNERYRYVFAVKLLNERKKHETKQKKQETVKRIRLLWKAITYLDEIVIRDSLRDLRTNANTPLFRISELVAKAVW